MKYLPLIGLLMLTACATTGQNTKKTTSISHQPTTLPSDCGDGNAKLYDECGDQTKILETAIKQAQDENKTVLITYGGEWCIWCHVLDKYLHGQFRTFDYQWRDSNGDMSKWLMNEEITEQEISDANTLSQYVADNFVIAHIEADNTNGAEAIAMTGFDPNSIYYYPYVLALDRHGRYVAEMPSLSAIEHFEIRESGGEEFRGYNREILLKQLQKLRNQTE